MGIPNPTMVKLSFAFVFFLISGLMIETNAEINVSGSTERVICRSSDRWMRDCNYCEESVGVMIVFCNRCSCKDGKPFGCTKKGCRKICSKTDQWLKDCNYCETSVMKDCNRCFCKDTKPFGCTKKGCPKKIRE